MVCKTQLKIRNKTTDIKRNIQKHNQSWIVYVKAQFCLFNGTKKCLSEPGLRSMIQSGFLSYQVEWKNLPGPLEGICNLRHKAFERLTRDPGWSLLMYKSSLISEHFIQTFLFYIWGRTKK